MYSNNIENNATLTEQTEVAVEAEAARRGLEFSVERERKVPRTIRKFLISQDTGRKRFLIELVAAGW